MGSKIKEFDMGDGKKTWMFWSPADNQHIGINNTWEFNGDFENPTFKPSIKMTVGSSNPDYCSHMYVTDGKIQYLEDCTHDMKGQTVDMVDIDESYFTVCEEDETDE